MEQYAGLDVSLKAVSIYATDASGAVLWRGEVANDARLFAPLCRGMRRFLHARFWNRDRAAFIYIAG